MQTVCRFDGSSAARLPPLLEAAEVDGDARVLRPRSAADEVVGAPATGLPLDALRDLSDSLGGKLW